MSAEASTVYDYEIDYPLVEGLPFHTMIREIEKHSDRFVKQFESEFSRGRYRNGRQFVIPTTYGDISMKFLGAGGNGIAYQLTIKDTVYVLKIVIHHPAKDKPLVQEIEMLKAVKGKWFALQLLASSALLTTDSYGDAAYNIYMLYPYIEGNTLDRYMNGVETDEEIRDKLNDILQGLHELHEMGILHDDIKAENIWIPKDSAIKPFFLDFGGSHWIDNGKYKASSNYTTLGFLVENELMPLFKTLSKPLVTQLKNGKNGKGTSFGGKRTTRRKKNPMKSRRRK